MPFKSKSGLKAQLETEWENFAKANYAKAKELAEKALAISHVSVWIRGARSYRLS